MKQRGLPVQSQGSDPSAPPNEDLDGRRTVRRSLRGWLMVVVIVLAVAGGCGLYAKTSTADSDADGLPDRVERSGWLSQGGGEYRTDPDRADTDGDGLPDGVEAGTPGTDELSDRVYSGYSNPLLPDTDGDGLGDADEADLGLDPFDRDSDDDRLEDGHEVQVVGSAPDTADTDGDGFDDGYEAANRDSQGLDPLSFDAKVSTWSYATDFAKGAVLGDLDREDSLAWLAGNLASGGSSLFPGVGWGVGAAADVRDVIGSATHADWVGAGFSAVGLVPGGDAVAIPGKAAEFVARNPRLAAEAAAAVSALDKIPVAVKIDAARRIWRNWDDLIDSGADEKALLALQAGRTNLDDLSDARRRHTHVDGPTTRSFPDGKSGEEYLEELYGTSMSRVDNQVWASTTSCVEVCNEHGRRFDVLVDGVAHESKVGHVSWSDSVAKQIQSDAWLVEHGDIDGAHWHFFASSASNTLGADRKVLDLLSELGIPYTVHLAAGN